MAKDVTLADIAAKVGVSNVAVYKALTDKPGVSAKLREEIKLLAKEMGYTSGGAEAGRKTGNIGVIVPEQYYGYSTSFYGQLYEKVVKALYKSEYFGILELLTLEDEKNICVPKVMQGDKVDGLIFIGQMQESYIDFMINQTKLPVFFLDTYVPLSTFDTVISDGYYGTYIMTSYLISLGFRRIGFVGSVDATGSIADRFWGYRKALRENGIAYEESWEIPDRDERGNLLETIAENINGLEAFVCNCDLAAHTLIQNLEGRGYQIPGDISVVGVDDFLPAGMDNTRITSYKVDMTRMAELCVKSLIKKIQGKKYAEGVQIVTGGIVYKRTVAKKNEERRK
ncbi:MAG: substrate-binding domain-containing protein [Clostridium sp.]|nr:substrate-binding domain-containing protein [Clostridium sp.]